MTPLTTIIEEEKKEAHKLMQNGRYYGQTKAGDCMAGFYTEEDMGTILINTIQRVAKAMREEAWQEAIDLADTIELREPDGGAKQWMAFKAFRNTLRDKIKAPTPQTPLQSK